MKENPQASLAPRNIPALVRKPTFCCIGIAPQCMFRCKMCFFWKNKYIKTPQEPTLKEWDTFLDSLAGLKEEKIEINLAGGEPLLDERNLELARLGSKKGFYTSLNTNGFLIDRAMASKIADTGLDLVVISLDSLNKDTHDFLRGVDGSYDLVMRAIDHLDKCSSGPEIWILTIITGKNLGDIVKLAEWVNAHSRIRRIVFQAIAQPFNTPLIDGWHKKSEYSFLWPGDIKKAAETIDELIRLKNSGYKITNAVTQLQSFKEYFQRPQEFIKKSGCNVDFYMNINHLGEVFMCTLKESIGNIKKESAGDIWNSEAAFRVRGGVKKCSINCHHLINCCYEQE